MSCKNVFAEVLFILFFSPKIPGDKYERLESCFSNSGQKVWKEISCLSHLVHIIQQWCFRKGYLVAKGSQALVRQLNLVGSPCKAQTGSTQKAEINGVKDPTEGAGSYSEAEKGFFGFFCCIVANK